MFTIVFKVLANRLYFVMPILVDQVQSAFIKGGFIMHSFPCTHKVRRKIAYARLVLKEPMTIWIGYFHLKFFGGGPRSK